jgi:hypothetical protein
MSVTLDGLIAFEEQGLTITVGSPTRAYVERSACGLDGTVSIDLGTRGRRIQQAGMLRAASRAALNARISTIAAFIDGGTHTLVTTDGRVYGNLRMDSFTQTGKHGAGPGIVMEYEIVYTQLGD